MQLTVGARVAIAVWVLMAAIIWLTADQAGPLDEFEKQVKLRCEQLGHVFVKGHGGSLVCAKREGA